MRRILVLFAFLLTACHRRSDPAPEAQYLCALENSAVRAYPLEAKGPVKPVRSLGDQVGLRGGRLVAVMDGEIVVADQEHFWPRGRTLFFGRDDQGNVAPRKEVPFLIGGRWNAKHREFLGVYSVSEITGLAEDARTVVWKIDTGSSDVRRLVAVDDAHDEILVLSQGRVRVYRYGASGAATPLREFDLPGVVVRMEMDAAHAELLAIVAADGGTRLIAYSSSGVQQRSAMLVGASSWGPSGYSAAHDEVFVVSTAGDSISVYPRLASGSAQPRRTLSAGAEVSGLIIDDAQDELIVARRHGPANDYTTPDERTSLAVFAATDSGSASPRRLIDGGLSGAANTSDLAADAAGGDVFVNAWSPASIAVFSIGKTPARRSIWTPADGLAFGGNELFTVRNNTVGILSLEGAPLRSFTAAGGEYSSIGYDEKRQRVWLGSGAFAEIYTRDGALVGTSAAWAGFFGFDPDGEVWVLASPGRIAAYRIDAGDAEPLQAIDLAHPATGRPLFLAGRQELYVPTEAGVDVYAGGALTRLEGVHASKLAACQ